MSRMTSRSLVQHVRALHQKEYSAEELTRAYLDRIALREAEVGAFLTLDPEGALAAARASDARRTAGEPLSALDGIPFALKDNFCTKGMLTTCGSRMLANFVPPYNATVVERLHAAGAVLFGKLNMDEFAMGSTTETSALGVTRNPIAPDRVPGGSSGGSAAAVAAGEVSFALGSDTGGSVRQPAAFCGVVGLKPTYGVISRYGMIAMASSLDCVGLVTRSAADACPIFSVLAGRDPRDATSCDLPQGARGAVDSLRGLRIGVVRELMEDDSIAPAIHARLQEAVQFFAEQGARIVEVSLPSPDVALAAYCVISAAEASSNLARYDGICFGKRTAKDEDLFSLYANSRAEGFGSEVKRRILFGSYMLSEGKRTLYYDRACNARAAIRTAMTQLVGQCDLILTPTTPTTAFARGGGLTPAQRRRADLCAVYSSLAGLPAVSVPVGCDENGLPIGLQLTAEPFAEALLLSVAKRLEACV